jgi:hypothetical protein
LLQRNFPGHDSKDFFCHFGNFTGVIYTRHGKPPD